MSAVSPRELVMLPVVAGSGDVGEIAAAAKKRLLELDAAMRPALQSAAVVSIGVALPGSDGVPLSYQCAKRTVRVGRSRDRSGRLFSYYDLSFPVLLSGLGAGWQADQFSYNFV